MTVNQFIRKEVWSAIVTYRLRKIRLALHLNKDMDSSKIMDEFEQSLHGVSCMVLHKLCDYQLQTGKVIEEADNFLSVELCDECAYPIEVDHLLTCSKRKP